jgi:hypothetical protein
MYSAGKPVDLQKQKTQTYVYREFLLTIVYAIVQTYIISILVKSKDMAVNLISCGTAMGKSRNYLQAQVSRSISNESDSACSETSENNESIPETNSLTSDCSSESNCGSEFSEGHSPFTFSSKSCKTCVDQTTSDFTSCQIVAQQQDVFTTKYASSQPVFTFQDAEPENMEVKTESAITPGDLVHLINNNESILLLDCRSFMAHNSNHISGSLNVGCSDRITKKRLSDGKIQIVDVICGQEGKDMYRRLESDAHIVVYDDNTVDLKCAPATQSLRVLADCLRKQNKPFRFLQGGLQAFQQTYSSMCTNPEPAASLPILFSPTSPELNVDIDTAVVSEILPHVLFGNQRDASDRERLRELGVTHIINVTSQLPLHFETDGIVYKRLPASDSGSQNLKQYFQDAIAFIDGVREVNGRVLVHCQAGVSRSPTIVIAYLMARSQKTLADAFSYVKDRRTIVAPNLNFMGQLLEFEQNSVQLAGLCPPSQPLNLLLM